MMMKKAAPSQASMNRSVVGTPFAVRPLARAVALILTVGSTGLVDAAPRPLSPAWMAAKAASRATAPAPRPGTASGARSLAQQQANRQLRRSIDNLTRTAGAIAAQRAAQEAARQAARQAASNIPDGLADGGLKVDADPDTAGWFNAEDPTQSVSDGHTTVNIKQTGNKAILNWKTFNVSRDTTVDFDQQANWAVLNRVNDPDARPSQIQGQINGDGTVMLVNRNGVVFSGSSQVNVRNLVAAAADISDEQFRERGLYGDNEGSQAVFTNAQGDIDVQAGARLTTAAPGSATQSGGYTLLAGRNVHNQGEIVTEQGQTTLAAGEDFYIRKGRGTEENLASTTDGNEVASRQSAASALDGSAGTVTNSGLILSSEGDITLTGHDVRQQGVAVATTTVDKRGTIHLLNSASDASGQVTLGEGSVTAVVIDEDGGTALDTRRQTLINQSAKYDLEREGLNDGVFDNLAELPDRRDQSRVEIVSGGDVIFEDDSLTQATGGQIAVAANDRVRVETGAELDVSGAVGVRVAMESNNVLINVQSNEQRDSPVNRDSGALRNGDVWIDRRELIHVPAGTGGHDADRWYTAGGLLEVGGYLDTIPHSAGEWAAAGGTVRLHGDAVIAQGGSAVNLSGGTLNVQTGYIRQTWLKGADGNLYDAATAPGYLRYTGLYRGYERTSERWGQTQAWRNPLINPEKRLENGYVTGRDAGQLIVSAPTAILEGDIVAEVYNGERQNRARAQGLDGYNQAQNSVARAGQLLLGKYGLLGLSGGFDSDVRVGDIEDVAGELERNAELGERLGTVWLDAARLSEQGLGGLDLVSAGGIAVEQDLDVTPGGYVRLASGQVDVDATVTARGGDITLTNIIEVYDEAAQDMAVRSLTEADGETYLRLGGDGVLDARGLWTSQGGSGGALADMPYRHGGRVEMSSTQDVILEQGSLIDVSSGAARAADGSLLGARGGDITLHANAPLTDNVTDGAGGVLTLDGELRGYGVDGGGTLHIESGDAIVVGGEVLDTEGLLPAGEAAPVDLTLLEAAIIAAGQPLPFDYSYTRDAALPGQPFGNSPNTISGNPVTLAADWVVPPGDGGSLFRLLGDGAVYGTGDPVPAGTTITLTLGTMDPNYVVPADAFPNGIPVQPTQATLSAGSAAPFDVTLEAGYRLAAGATLGQDAHVRTPLSLDTDLFQKGFSDYQISGHSGLVVAENAQLEASMPVYRFTDQATFTGGRDEALELWTPPLHLETPEEGILSQRAGASLALSAERNGVVAPLLVEEGARVSVDPGQSIRLSGGRQVTVEGTLSAPGGEIDILGGIPGGANQTPKGGAIWIGEQALLDVSGRAYVATDPRGRRYGQVLDAGRVTLGGAAPEGEVDDNSYYPLTDLFVVVRDGAVIDLSGASAKFDLSGGGEPTRVAGDAGGLAMRSTSGIYFDGELRARSGGDGAAGGALEVMLESRLLNAIPNPDEAVLRNITLGSGLDSGLSQGVAPGVDDGSLEYGRARFDVDGLVAAGVDDLSLWARDAILFDGDTEVNMDRSLSLSATLFGATVDNPDISVDLSAPYVRLGGRTSLPVRPGTTGVVPSFLYDDSTPLSSLTSPDSRFSVKADLIDLGRGALTFGGRGRRQITGERLNDQYLPVDLPGFADVRFDSQGDVRLDNAVVMTGQTLSFLAERIYPVTHSVNILRVGLGEEGRNGDPLANALLRFERRGQGELRAPLSVFGSLYMQAPNIQQGGALLAPLGTLGFVGDSGSDSIPANGLPYNASVMPAYFRELPISVSLLDGSITSVSAQGLVLPYGGIENEVDYAYNGEEIEFDQAGVRGSSQSQRTDGGIRFGTATFLSEEGAVVDTSAGGVLRGVSFIPGQGGSVNILDTALANAAPWHAGDDGARVYAIMAGLGDSAAPIDSALSGPDQVGRQITIGDGVPGLPAGTYTLLPAEYALMPGGYRVELGGNTPYGLEVNSDQALGVHTTTVYEGLANTHVLGGQPKLATIMAGDTVRRYSRFDETTLSQWVAARQAQFGAPRLPVLIPEDVRPLSFDFGNADPSSGNVFRFEGELRNATVEGGNGGMVAFHGTPLEVMAEGGEAAEDRVTLLDEDLNRLQATVLGLGVEPLVSLGAQSNLYGRDSVVLRNGTSLKAGTVVLAGQSTDGDAVVVESGATIDTRGLGEVGWGANGLILNTLPNQSTLVVSNDRLQFGAVRGGGRLRIEDGAALYSEGTLGLLAPGGAGIAENIDLRASDLLLAMEDLNVGTDDALDQAASAGILSDGWRLTQNVLDGLLGRADGGIENLSFQASNSINFFGPVSLDTYNADTGESSSDLRFITPAIYGLAGDGEEAVIRTDRFIWSGLATQTGQGSAAELVPAEPGPVIDGGAGSGDGGFRVEANDIVFGVGGAPVDAAANLPLERLMLGFRDVAFNGAQRITSDRSGTLSVYERALDGDLDTQYEGGNLTFNTPVLTGQAGSEMAFRAGRTLRVARPEGAEAVDRTNLDLGGRLTLDANRVRIDGTVAAPSGRVELFADEDVELTDGSLLDVAGRSMEFFDVTRYSFGGDLILNSDHGDIRQAEGAVLDVSASGNDAGIVKAVAAEGEVDLAGELRAGNSEERGNAFDGGAIEVEGRTIADFVDLNRRLGEGGFDYRRDFILGTGDLVIGEELRARHLSVTADGGGITVDGDIQAGGRYAGSLRLAARDDLTIQGGILLDASGDQLKRDSSGGVIEGSNRALLDLTSGEGRLSLGEGAVLDVSTGGENRGTINLNAPRLGGPVGDDMAVDASDALVINGAKRVALNGFWTYDDASFDLEDDTTQVIDEAYLDRLDSDSKAFVDGALANEALLTRIAGLREAASETFQLRPGVDIVSANDDGNLRVAGDLDLGDYRYGPDVVVDRRGSGWAGVFSLRAGGDLEVNGSISDGFEVPPEGPDSSYYADFVFDPDMINAMSFGDFLAQDFLVSESLKLRGGWALTPNYRVEGALPFDLSADSIYRINLGQDVPVPFDVTLDRRGAVLIPGNDGFVTTAEIVLSRPVTDESGTTYSGVIPVGTRLFRATLPGGSVLKEGFIKPYGTLRELVPMTIPAGTSLAAFEIEVRSGPEQTLAVGSVLPKNLIVTPGLEETTLTQQRVQPLASALPAGTESWDLRVVAGASLSSANLRAVRPGATAGGDLLLNNPYSVVTKTDAGSENYQFGVSVVRTGSGDLELIAARDYRHETPFGVYTAGGALAQNTVPAVERPRQDDGTLLGSAYSGDTGDEEDRDYNRVAETTSPAFLTGGGNVTVRAGRHLQGYRVETSAATGDWLRSQGGVASGEGAAWWINTGTYEVTGNKLVLPTFAGIGALGGGNVNVSTGGNLGVTGQIADQNGDPFGLGGIQIAVGASGWIGDDGSVYQVGGGDLNLNVGARTDPYQGAPSVASSATNLRGDLRVRAGAVGNVRKTFQVTFNSSDPRPVSLRREVDKETSGRLKLVAGDARVRVQSVGDLVAEVIDPMANNGALDLWAAGTAMDFLTTGGDLVFTGESTPADTRVIAASGDLYGAGNFSPSPRSVLVRPSMNGQVEFLAGDSVYSLGLSVEEYDEQQGVRGVTPTRIYARSGDIFELKYGYASDLVSDLAGRPAFIRAGRDIVNLGAPVNRTPSGGVVSQTGASFGHYTETDVSLIEAGRDLIHINARVIGPGTLELTAGRNFYQADRGWVRSMAGLSEDVGSGADIAINVGMGREGPDYQALIDAYLNPANLSNPDRPLADQANKVAKVYDQELRAWLEGRYGDTALEGTTDLAYFEALSPEQQRIFLRELYYSELRAGGREYNDPDGDRSGSYLRGRRVVKVFLPKAHSEAGTSGYQGDYTMFSTGENSGLVRTEGGGDIEMLVPGGDLIIGTNGVRPEYGDNGILTQGRGDIQLYSQGNIGLGLSRIFTTYGGDIFAWSAAGDINAGRGAKTTLVYTPPRRVYDDIGNVSLSPVAPTTGAGIATLAPIPEVPPGDIDLIAPLGVIDAGEAGIRVSGDVNIAALQVVNAENIQVQGESTGLPAVASVNVGALTNATNAANSAVQAAEQVSRGDRGNRPSVITVEILGYGQERLVPEQDRNAGAPDYRPDGVVRVLGAGELSEEQGAALTDAERRSML